MTFDGYRAPSFLSIDGAKDICVEFFSLSKMYNMTGWRVGFAAGNEAGVKALGVIKSNTDSGVFKAIQRAAAVGLQRSDELTSGLNEIYGKRRTLFVEGLRELGWDLAMPEATFYLWLPVPQGMTSVGFAAKMLDAGVVVPPGNGYGEVGEGFFRVALTVPEARLTEALGRMKEAGIRYDMTPTTV
jgi:LL-diaminopimelate aminotransferase